MLRYSEWIDTTVQPFLSERAAAVLKASRPAGWCFGPILFGIGLIHSRVIPRSPGEILRAMLLAMSLSVPLCTIVFGINDVADSLTDLVNPRKYDASLEGQALRPVYHPDVRMVAWASTFLIIACAGLARQRSAIRSAAVLVFFGWQYSAKPLRLKEIPILDSLSNALIVLMPILTGFTLGGSPAKDLPRKDYMLAVACSGLHAIGAAADYEADQRAGQRTIATYFGKRTAIVFAFFSFSIPAGFEGFESIFGVYLQFGRMILGTAIWNTDCHYVRTIFQMIVYWSMLMVAVWFIVQAGKPVVKWWRGSKIEDEEEQEKNTEKQLKTGW